MADAVRPIDADNHYYETLDAFTRHLDPAFKHRGVRVVRDGKRVEILIGGAAVLIAALATSWGVQRSLRNLQLKQSSVDLKVRRHATDVSMEILERRGHVQVSVVFG